MLTVKDNFVYNLSIRWIEGKETQTIGHKYFSFTVVQYILF